MAAIDVDQHLYEPRTVWRDYIHPACRDDALSIDDDALGYAWLTWRKKQLYLAEVQFPGKATPIGAMRKRQEASLPAEERYDDMIPTAYADPKARADSLDEWGLDSAVLFPNFGLLWEDMLAGEPVIQMANLTAYNRWICEAIAQGGPRLHGVAHLVVRDPAWVEEELAACERAGIKLAMVAPAPVDGKPLSHPDLDPVWRSFVEHDVAPVFHVGGFEGPLHPAWYTGDPEPVDKVMGSVFLWVAPAVAIANMIIHGTLERHPELRLGVVELSAHWVPQFLLMLDGSWGFYAARHGGPLTDLPMRPSEYFRRQVRVAALAYEQPAKLIETIGEDVFMFGSDWPHAEGIGEPLHAYERCVEGLSGVPREKLFAGNAGWLLGAR